METTNTNTEIARAFIRYVDFRTKEIRPQIPKNHSDTIPGKQAQIAAMKKFKDEFNELSKIAEPLLSERGGLSRPAWDQLSPIPGVIKAAMRHRAYIEDEIAKKSRPANSIVASPPKPSLTKNQPAIVPTKDDYTKPDPEQNRKVLGAAKAHAVQRKSETLDVKDLIAAQAAVAEGKEDQWGEHPDKRFQLGPELKIIINNERRAHGDPVNYEKVNFQSKLADLKKTQLVEAVGNLPGTKEVGANTQTLTKTLGSLPEPPIAELKKAQELLSGNPLTVEQLKAAGDLCKNAAKKIDEMAEQGIR